MNGLTGPCHGAAENFLPNSLGATELHLQMSNPFLPYPTPCGPAGNTSWVYPVSSVTKQWLRRLPTLGFPALSSGTAHLPPGSVSCSWRYWTSFPPIFPRRKAQRGNSRWLDSKLASRLLLPSVDLPGGSGCFFTSVPPLFPRIPSTRKR